MDTTQRQILNKYLDLFFRRKIFIFTVLLLSLPVGLGIYLDAPKIYQSSSLVSYQRQKINPNKLSPDVKAKVRDVVNTLTQIVTSRNNLEEIILKLDLYAEQRKRLPIEDVIEKFRNQIEVIPSKKADVFTVYFSDSDPEKVVRATNAIAAKFIEANLKYRHERATDTSSYTKEELHMAKLVMDRQENAMRDYKLKNYNEMPQHRQANMSRMTSLQRQYQGKQESIQDLERTLVLIQDQIDNRRMLIQRSSMSSEDGGMSDLQKLAGLRATLDSVSLKYTEKHPEVVRLRKLIAKMETDIQASSTSGLEGRFGEITDEGSYDKIIMKLEVQQKGIKLKIANIEKEKELLSEKIDQYEKWVAAAPVREAEWSSLTREYEQLKKHYDYLVAQNLEAESMLNLEERQRGSQFKIEDPARYSDKPISPDFLRIMGMSVFVGLGIGFLTTLVFDFFDATFRDPDTVDPLLGIPLLITIPYVETKAEKKKNLWIQVLVSNLLLSGVVLVAALFTFVGTRGYIII